MIDKPKIMTKNVFIISIKKGYFEISLMIWLKSSTEVKFLFVLRILLISSSLTIRLITDLIILVGETRLFVVIKS